MERPDSELFDGRDDPRDGPAMNRLSAATRRGQPSVRRGGHRGLDDPAAVVQEHERARYAPRRPALSSGTYGTRSPSCDFPHADRPHAEDRPHKKTIPRRPVDLSPGRPRAAAHAQPRETASYRQRVSSPFGPRAGRRRGDQSPAFCSAYGAPPRRYRSALQGAGASGGLGAGEGPRRPPGCWSSTNFPATTRRAVGPCRYGGNWLPHVGQTPSRIPAHAGAGDRGQGASASRAASEPSRGRLTPGGGMRGIRLPESDDHDRRQAHQARRPRTRRT